MDADEATGQREGIDARVADDQVFLEAAAQGQTMFSSTGDTGSFCPVATPNGVPAGAPFVGFPATSPYVIGVGGTTLVTNADGTYNSEVAWYAGGGGISQFEYSPYWQSPVIPTNNPDVPGTGAYDAGGLYYGGEGHWRLVPNGSADVQSSSYATRISSNMSWIRSVLGNSVSYSALSTSASSTTFVPEPSSIAMLAVAALGLWRRRRF